MTTALALVTETRRLLEQNQRAEQNTLTGSYTAGGTSLTFSEAMRSILDGAELEIDSELFRVTGVASATATVKGAQRGTTAANHSSGANVLVNPRFPTISILSDMNHTLSEMEANGLYKVTAENITFNSEVSGYALTATDVREVLEVRYKDTGPDKRFPVIPSWSLLRNMDVSDFASGTAIVLDRGGFPGQPLRVRYATPFTRITSTADVLESTVGLSTSMLDLLPLGAAIRQMQTRDTRRSFLESQPDTRRSNEVPPGASQSAIREMRRTFDKRLGEERMRLIADYPYRNRRVV